MSESIGSHIIVDVWGGKGINDPKNLRKIFSEMAHAGKATILNILIHEFPTTGGLTGVAILAESHISVHTWPERDFAAFDIFMCGKSTPIKALSILEAAVTPEKIIVKHLERGII